mgnify:CR=1 FL=1|jgi:imidazole glycerol-phosphate synthase subunit HisH
MSRKNIGIVNYGAGNINSLKNTLQNLGYKVSTPSLDHEIRSCDSIFLPGVGAFPEAMKALQITGIDQSLKKFYRSGKPMIGICLGFQLFANKSHEIEPTRGLSFIDGEVIQLPQTSFHIGWNEVNFKGNSKKTFSNKNVFFFNHSYFLQLKSNNILGKSSIKSIKNFPAFYKKENLAGVQFHPEKSQENGILFLDSLLKEMLND